MGNELRLNHIQFIEKDTKERGEQITGNIKFIGSIYFFMVKVDDKKARKTVKYSAAEIVMPGYRKIIS